MLRDVFYYGSKPNVHPREKFATSFEDAKQQATTEHFWIINERCDYQGFDWDFDFDFLPDEDVWAETHINVWPSQHQKDSGTWLCNTDNKTPLIIYRADVNPVKRKNEKNSNWILKDSIDESKFDFSWHPDPTDPLYIYIFPTNWNPVGGPEYHVVGAIEKKFLTTQIGVTVPRMDKWNIPTNINITGFDFSWVPHPDDPPFIYEFGTQWQNTGGPQYIVEGADEIKYIDTLRVNAIVDMSHWTLPTNIDIAGFDFSWHPDNTSPLYIYRFPTQWAISGGPVYTVPGATEVKYIEDMSATAIADPERKNWEVPAFIDVDSFDFSWHPYEEDEPYVYHFGTQWQKTGGPVFKTPGVHANSAIKYIDTRIIDSKRLPSKRGFATLSNLKIKDFDYSWHPDTTEEPYIYQFGNQYYPAEIMPTIEYAVPGATQIKYINEIIATLGPDKTNWVIIQPVNEGKFDFSWKPNPKDPPYIYIWGNSYIDGKIKSTIEYHVDGATEKKYMDELVEVIPEWDRWDIPKNIDTSKFDFTWRPDPLDADFIWQFGTQHQKTGGPKYTMPDATGIKYVDFQKAIAEETSANWEVPTNIDVAEFDFSWHPDATETPYVYVFGTQWALTGGPKYIAPGAIEVKYIDTIIAKAAPNKKYWTIPDDIDENEFDFSWHPYAEDEPFIYQFGTQWQKTGGPVYMAPDADATCFTKYIDTRILKAKKLPSMKYWEVIGDLEVEEFDYSWHHDETEEPYIYVFGNRQYRGELMPTVQYVIPGATRVKYISSTVAKLAPYTKGWNNIEEVEKFDYSWRPDPTDPPYIYVFGNTLYPGTIMPTVELHIEGATEKKYVDDIVATLKPNKQLFTNTTLVKEFDYSWRPNPKDPPYIYQFGTQWAKTHGPQYIVVGATEVKYVDDVKAIIMPDMTNWEIPNDINVSRFDFSWHPDATGDPHIYQFGSVAGNTDGPRYVVPLNNGNVLFLENVFSIESLGNEESKNYPKYFIKTTLEDLINEHSTEIFWALNPDMDYSGFDFDWRPDVYQSRYIQAFGTKNNINTQTYLVNAIMWKNGDTDINYVEDKTDTLKAKIDMFFVDRGNSESQARFDKLKAKFDNIQKTRYLNTWVDTINRCINRSTTNLCWILNSELDYDNFNFEYYPNPWQMKMVHVFGTQWSHWGTTFMVNRKTFVNDTKYVKIIEHLGCLNFVKERRAVASNIIYDTVYIDHGNKPAPINTLVIDYEESYLKTLKKLLEKLPNKKEHFVWVTSSICDYDGFDFTYICDPFARDQLHVFPSDKQKFGDTFLVNVNKLRELIDTVEDLKDIKVNYNQHQRVKRLPAPTIITESDTHVSTIHTDFNFPYATFQTIDNQKINVVDTEPMSLWTPDSKTIQITSVGGTRIVVPKEAKEYVKRELYDYPYIQTNKTLAKSTPMDIVFLSNGETGADENYEHLIRTTQGLPNRIVRIDGVAGRVAAYHAAATASNTPWMFTVFAKLKVNNKFDWNWQPDRLQIPKHYVFHAKNPVNGLVYGHMAMIAYNKKLTLGNEGKGLDFTMDDEHEIVEIVSGTANFNTDEWSTWRTSFREALKLRANNDEISKNRLEFWLTTSMGKFSEYSTDGAQHAVEYYESVNGDFEKLKLSYDWPWLKEYFNNKYN
jgi:hypothetical protein